MKSDNKLLKSLGDVIRSRRSKLDYSQEKFAEVVGLHRTYIGGIERGERNITILNLEKIAEKLDTRVSALLSEAENQG